MPSTIIVPLDGSVDAERALWPAAEVADRARAHVVVVTARVGGVVVEPHHYLSNAARAAGITAPESMVIEGKLAASAIASVVAQMPDPVVCLATHARQGFGEALFGSVAEEVLRLAGVPALLVGPGVHEHRQLEEVFVCIDGSSLSAAIVPVATAWAKSMRLRVTVVGVTNAAGGRGEDTGDVSADQLDDAVRRFERSGVMADARLLHGALVAPTLVASMHEHRRAFLAMATHGRTGLARLRAGSATIDTVRAAPCPVLTVRPTLLGGLPA